MREPTQSDLGATACPSCGEAPMRRYCGHCGERRLGPDDRAIKRYLDAIIDFFTSFDSKGYRSIWFLLTRPGHLSVEQLRGSRVRYAKPFALFLSLNVLCYVSISTFGTNAFSTPLTVQLNRNDYYGEFVRQKVEERIAAGTSFNELESRYDEKTSVLSRTMIFVFIPIYAAIFAVLFLHRRRYFVEHAVVATHLWCFILILLAAVVPPLASIFRWWGGQPTIAAALQANDGALSLILQAIIAVHMGFLVRRVYGASVTYSVIVSLGLAWAFFHIVWLYRFLLFLVTIWMIRPS